jgi:predicted kinase
MLYLVCGLPGTGKTSVAKELASLTGGIVLRTDEIRKQIIADPKYTPAEKKKVYEAMFRTTGSMLRAGTDVILDATFYKRKRREEAGKIAGKAGKRLITIEVKCDEKTVFERLKKRKGDLSDADYAVYSKIKREWEPISEKHFVIDTAGKNWKKDLKNILGNK